MDEEMIEELFPLEESPRELSFEDIRFEHEVSKREKVGTWNP